MMSEIFKDIAGYEGLYQIGNKGTIRSVMFRNNQTMFKRTKTLNPFDNGKGYLVISLCKQGKRKNYYIHRLVADAFIPHTKERDIVNHKDHNRHNNDATNLEWCTQKENVLYSADRMKHEKTKCKVSNTGEKYISRRKNTYRVQIPQKRIWKQFKTLEEAKAYKLEVMK